MANSSAYLPTKNLFPGLTPGELGELTAYIYYDDAGSALSYPLYVLDEKMQYNLIAMIHAGVRIAAAIVTGTVLLLIARSYRSSLFRMYELNFLLMIISSSLQMATYMGFPESITVFVTGGTIPASGNRLVVATSVFLMLLTFSLLASLIMQIYVACSDLRRLEQWLITAVAVVGCFPSILIWLWRVVLVGINVDTLMVDGSNAYEMSHDTWVSHGAWPAFAASVSFCSMILCIKLWAVHRQRVRMGVEKFGPIRILLTMALQNSLIPAILGIVSACLPYTNSGGRSVSAATIPITALMLPIGYIWAQFQISQSSRDTSVEVRSMEHHRHVRSKDSGYSVPYSASTADSPKSGSRF